MALATLVAGLKVKRRVLQFAGLNAGTLGVNGMSSEVAAQLRTFFETLGQLKGNPDLVLIPFSELSDTDTVFSDAACKVYAIYANKDTATLAWAKFADSATVTVDASANIVSFSSARIGDQLITWPSGFPMASGFVAQGNTTANGGTSSGTDAHSGFVILGAA